MKAERYNPILPHYVSVLFPVVLWLAFAVGLTGCSHFRSDKLINGSRAPQVSAAGPGGDPISLASFRGNVVLVNFWASWCKPCREENPKLVALYEKYKDVPLKNAGGLRIFSISLDSEKDKWLKAIEDDNMYWDTHASDLKGWGTAAADSFRVASIPSTFLIDPSGLIIGKDLKMKEFDKLLSLLASEAPGASR